MRMKNKVKILLKYIFIREKNSSIMMMRKYKCTMVLIKKPIHLLKPLILISTLLILRFWLILTSKNVKIKIPAMLKDLRALCQIHIKI